MEFKYSEDINICDHYDLCGGCRTLDMKYNQQLEQKTEMVKKYFLDNEIMEFPLSEVIESPIIYEYRNNMELSFGDLKKGGKLQLGMHLRGKKYDVVTIDGCYLIDQDFRKIIEIMIEYFRNTDLKKYHIMTKKGYLRNLKIRKGINTGEILINLITTSQKSPDLTKLIKQITNTNFKDDLVGFIHTTNDDYADAVKTDSYNIYYGRNYFYEKLLNMKFKVSSLSFFQVNTKAAEKHYSRIINYLENQNIENVFDLYSGTGSISQLISPYVENVTGIEINKNSVEHAKENLNINSIDNCNFIQGDVKDILNKQKINANTVIVDPPRPGLHSEVIKSIVKAVPDHIIYVSCNPKTQAQDIKKLLYNNYHIEDLKLIDMFPHTKHVESIAFIKKD
ncbi:MAG: 23S rRNA (uracil(1939)-C(5))-methyltransferase RlmD [Halanaerobiales bacterium]|nr:23S rRNA (uracil(1939)-C(5))-methyltransferase RlmD [Halanaerobiales bacterium]